MWELRLREIKQSPQYIKDRKAIKSSVQTGKLTYDAASSSSSSSKPLG